MTVGENTAHNKYKKRITQCMKHLKTLDAKASETAFTFTSVLQPKSSCGKLQVCL